MKSFIVLALLVAVAVAAPADPKDATIVRYDSDNIGVDGYNYVVETSDGKAAEESGQLVDAGTDNQRLVVRGKFAYIGPDGNTYTVTYEADENGFRAFGTHLPQSI